MTDILIDKKRTDYAIVCLRKAGYEIIFKDVREIRIEYKGSIIRFYPYTEWHTGKSIVDGTGIHNLIKQITAVSTKNK